MRLSVREQNRPPPVSHQGASVKYLTTGSSCLSLARLLTTEKSELVLTLVSLYLPLMLQK